MQFPSLLRVFATVGLLGVFIAPAAAAQPASATAGGSVEQIGFGDGGVFQPTGWVPMKVRLTPPGGETGVYLIRVHQADLDGDHVVYQRSVTLTGGLPNQEFWTYFKPQPVNPLDRNNLAANLRVVLADADGRELAQLSVRRSITPLYSGADLASGAAGAGKRLVLLVSDAGGFFPGSPEYIPGDTVGIVEQLVPVGITPDSLPDRAIGYDSVDTVVWQDADPAVLLSQGGGDRMLALRQWLRSGGKLVVTTRSEWQTLEPLFDLLPVNMRTAVERNDLAPLASIVAGNLGTSRIDMPVWGTAPGPFRYVVSDPKPEAIVESWFSYEQPSELGGAESGVAPLIARRAEGFGSVTWVALDFSNTSIYGRPSQRPAGWSIIWTQVLGLGDRPGVNPADATRTRFEAREYRDLGYSLLPGSRLAGRSVALVTVAMIFFIAYWLIAGPGLYFYLASRKRTPLSWFLFGAAAVIATFVTLGVVKLILRGPPDLRHVSVVRQGMVAPQVVHSEMGLYIPEDGSQRLLIDGGVVGMRPTLTGFSIDPDQHRGTLGRSNPINYVVNLDPPDPRNAGNVEGSATVMDVPYRSTLKKLEADWVGPVARGVDGRPALVLGSGMCEGRLTNVSGHDLVNVHIAFRYPRGLTYDVWVIYLPLWRNGQTIDGLSSLLRPASGEPIPLLSPRVQPSPSQAVRGTLANEWADQYWYRPLRSSMLSAANIVVDDWAERVRRSPAMLSFFSLLPPMENDIGTSSQSTMPLRRGARELDISAAIVAGNLVIVGEAEGVPLPLPMRVDGDKVEGTGRTIYQFVLPMDRSAFDHLERRPPGDEDQDVPATQATEPADEPEEPPPE